jgi:hypothetical protein
MKPIFNRLTGRHLDDATLAAIWTSTTAAGATVPAGAVDPHLASCGECRVRYDAFTSWMEELRTDARLEADEIFTPDRLAGQQAVISRRLEAAERPARVIAFPKFPAGSAGKSAPVRRWIAAAAAAGLLVGLGLGQIMDLRHLGDRRTFPVPRTVQQPRVDAAARAAVQASTAVSDEMLLLELEAAATPQYEVLRAYDTLTPRAADFVQSSR